MFDNYYYHTLRIYTHGFRRAPMQLPQKSSQSGLGYVPGSDANLIAAYLHRYDRPQTRRAYENDLTQFFGRSYVTVADVLDVSFLHVNQHLLDLENAGAKPTTMRRRVAAIRGFFEWLVALGVLEKNPANRQVVRRVRGVYRRERAVTFLSATEAAALVAACETDDESSVRNRALILTLLHCVLRRSEAAAMDVEHLRPLGHYWVLDLPLTKGGSDQYVKVPAEIAEEIHQMQSHYGITGGPLWRSLSPRNRGERLTPHSIYRIVQNTALRAGLSERIGAHTLRHTGCTLAIEAGASVQQVQAHARHKNLETTMIYVHQRDRLRDSAADYIRIKKK